MKSIVKQFLSYRYHHPRRLFSTNVVTGHPRRLFSTNEVTGSSTSDGEDNKASDDDDNVKEENSEDNDKHLKKISELEEEVKDMKDKYMRSLAEVDNVRNIAKRDVQNALTRQHRVSFELANVIGTNTSSRGQITKGIWAYIKQNDLQQPHDRRLIRCDYKLQQVFDGNTEIHMLSIGKLVQRHILEPVE